MKHFWGFWHSEDGAASMDFVVIAAVGIGITLATLMSVSAGVITFSDDLETSVSEAHGLGAEDGAVLTQN